MHKLAFALAALVIAVTAKSAPVDKPNQLSLVESPAISLTERFEHAVNDWVDELAKLPEFAEWKNAEWQRTPLGPGMHGWIVSLKANGKEVGYLIVSSNPDGEFTLVEYGAGEYPLFSETKLYHELVRQALIPSSISLESFQKSDGYIRSAHYSGPFRSVWIVTISGNDLWLEGKTGEQLPLSNVDADALYAHIAEPTGLKAPIYNTVKSEITKSKTSDGHDPFYDLSWVNKPPLNIKDLQELQALLDADFKLTYVTEQYNQTVLYAFAVTGYHQWDDGSPFIQIDHEGTRFIPAEAMMREGRFYVVNSEPDPA